MFRWTVSTAIPAILVLLTLQTSALAGECSLARPSGTPDYSPPPKSMQEAFETPFLHFTSLSSRQLLIWGGVCAGDDEQVEALFKANRIPNEITFISPGGHLVTGMAIGELIRARHLTTRIRKDTICASSCNFMFLGGVIRIVEPDGQFMVHMFANGGVTDEDEDFIEKVSEADANLEKIKEKNPGSTVTKQQYIRYLLDKRIKAIQESAASTASVIGRYLLEMQLSMRFLTAFANIPNEHPRVLTRAELKSFNITNTDD